MKSKKYVIRVTKQDIKKGRAASIHLCPVALALRRYFQAKRTEVKVWSDPLTVKGSCFRMPCKVMNFINRFDDGQKVKPFSFTISL